MDSRLGGARGVLSTSRSETSKPLDSPSERLTRYYGLQRSAEGMLAQLRSLIVGAEEGGEEKGDFSSSREGHLKPCFPFPTPIAMSNSATLQDSETIQRYKRSHRTQI